MNVDALAPTPFGRLADGSEATLYTLDNGILRVRIMDWGGRVVSIEAPDRSGRRGEVTLGFDDVAAYQAAGAAFGALLGRNANRIAGGSFELDGKRYRLPTNDRGATLHGGPGGFGQIFWRIVEARGGTAPALVLAYRSPDGDQGFPGTLDVAATYCLEDDTLRLEFDAATSAPTILSLSAHPYFNLAGTASGDVLGHFVEVAAAHFLPTDATQIPTGEIRPTAGTPFDFRAATMLGARIRHADRQLLNGQGYDHYFVLDRADWAASVAARVHDPASGRVLEIVTTQPGLQLYAGNKLDGSLAGRGGVLYRQSAGLALEPQGFPDAVHHPNFPSSVLRPGQRYAATIRYRFATI